MTFKCPLCGQAYLLDLDQEDKTFTCQFGKGSRNRCKTVFDVDHVGGKLRVMAYVAVRILDTVPSYTPLLLVKDM